MLTCTVSGDTITYSLSSLPTTFSQQALLAEAPKDTSDIVNKLVEDMITVSNMPSK